MSSFAAWKSLESEHEFLIKKITTMNNDTTSMKNTDPPIVIEQLYPASIDKVWAAITERDQMVQWFFSEIHAFEPIVGFETTFTIINSGHDFPHVWKLIEVIPQKKITYHWSYENYPGESLTTFELFEKDGKAGIKLTYIVEENFPDGMIEFTRESGVQGWSYFIQGTLKEYLVNSIEP